MPVVFVNFPEATPGCTCPTCKEIREADRERKDALRAERYAWDEQVFSAEQLIRPPSKGYQPQGEFPGPP